MKFILTLLAALLFCGTANAQSAPRKYLSAATTNSTLVKTGKTLLNLFLPINLGVSGY